VIKKLLKLGANLNSEDFKKRKPIDIAIHKNNNNIVEIIKEQNSFFTCIKQDPSKINNSSDYQYKFLPTLFY
jgi:hypothetical protein